MPDLEYISESEMRAIILEESERATKLGRQHIMNPKGFSEHLISVGNKAEEVAKRIVNKNPFLKEPLDHQALRVTGYVHDFAKIGGNTTCPDQYGGDMWHDAEMAYQVLTRNEEFGLVKGKANDIKYKLIEIALGITSDYSLAEEMGGDFPKTAAYPLPSGFEQRVAFLRKALSDNSQLLSWEKLCLPETLSRKIAQYVDLVDIGGGEKQLEERLNDVILRYSRWADDAEAKGNYVKANHFRHQVGLTCSPKIRSRLLSTVREIENLL